MFPGGEGTSCVYSHSLFVSFFTIGNFEAALVSESNVLYSTLYWFSWILSDVIITSKIIMFLLLVFHNFEFCLGGVLSGYSSQCSTTKGSYVRTRVTHGTFDLTSAPIGRWYPVSQIHYSRVTIIRGFVTRFWLTQFDSGFHICTLYTYWATRSLWKIVPKCVRWMPTFGNVLISKISTVNVPYSKNEICLLQRVYIISKHDLKTKRVITPWI